MGAQDIRKTHFVFGSENGAQSSISKKDFGKKGSENDTLGQSKKAFQSTNFSLGDQTPAQMPTSHLHYPKYNNVPVEKLNQAQKADLRASHFILGKHPDTMFTENNIYGNGSMNQSLQAQRTVSTSAL